MQIRNSFFHFPCFEYVSHFINITLMPGMATAELVMKCNVSVREHSKLPVQHSCSPAFMEDLVIRKCIIPFEADSFRDISLRLSLNDCAENLQDFEHITCLVLNPNSLKFVLFCHSRFETFGESENGSAHV